MVFKEVGVFVEVDCFQGELAQALASVGIGCGPVGDTAAAELGACSVLGYVSMRTWIQKDWIERRGDAYLVIHDVAVD